MKIAGVIVDGLKANPFVLALVVINVIFLIGVGYGLREISASAARRDALLAQMIEQDCRTAPKGDRQ